MFRAGGRYYRMGYRGARVAIFSLVAVVGAMIAALVA